MRCGWAWRRGRLPNAIWELSNGTISSFNIGICLLCLLPHFRVPGMGLAWYVEELDETWFTCSPERWLLVLKYLVKHLTINRNSAYISFLLPSLLSTDDAFKSVCLATTWELSSPPPCHRNGHGQPCLYNQALITVNGWVARGWTPDLNKTY